MKKTGFFLLAAALTAGVMAAPRLASAQSVSFTGTSYTQNFDSLPLTGSTAAWANGTTLNGWYSVFGSSGGANTTRATSTTAVSTINVGTGSGSAGGLYSYGLSSSDTDRALGTQGSGTWEGVFAVVIQNNSGLDITDFTLTYDGEQWRRGGTVAQGLTFDFAVLTALPLLADLDAANVTNYTAVPALNFADPVLSSTSGALNGNLAANRVAGITSNVTAAVPNGSYLVLRWWENDDSGNDNASAIDNLTFSANTIPSPGTTALLGLGGLMMGRRRRH